MARGRPSAFKPEFAEEAQKLCKLGATDAELADFFAVSIVTIWAWQRRYPEFLSALKAGKQEADDRVERSLYQKAIGYTFDAVKIFCSKDGDVTQVPYREHAAPDTTAAIFWLKNRRSSDWREKTEHIVRNETSVLSDDELGRIAAGSGAGTAETSGNPKKLN